MLALFAPHDRFFVPMANTLDLVQGPDPTNGFVTYLDSSTAQSAGLYKTIGNQIFIGVDNTSVLDPNGAGRKSLKLQSNAAFTEGLFIADFRWAKRTNLPEAAMVSV